jgi:signal transduction histidine kinase
MEAQLLVTNRLSSIGELASGIAHELNNPLTSIIGFSDLLLGRELPDDVKEDLTIINTEAQRTAKIVKNLLSFARSRAPEEKSVSVNDAIGKILELRAYEQKVNDIEVTTRFAADLPEVTADEFQLQQVFLNLVINAEYFMKLAHDRGTLVIITERAGDVVRVSFADDGPGIAPESLPRLFDPFFTTKEVGKGTGLGLSICHGIISAHGGKIYAESELGKGATFFVELPIGKPWFSQLGSGEVKSRQDEAKDDAG